MTEQSKIMKTVEYALELVGAAALIGWGGKKVLKETLTGDPSSSFMNFIKWVGVMSGSILGIDYLKDKKVIPDSM